MKTGDIIQVRACKADGTVYRSWHATIESVEPDSIVTISLPGSHVFDLEKKHYQTKHIMRSHYWFDKFYNLIEVFSPDGRLEEVYLNIASPPRFENGGMSYTDHELDVSKFPHHDAELVDEDEFAEAIVKYHYSQEFQQTLQHAAVEAIALADNWQVKPVSGLGGDHA